MALTQKDTEIIRNLAKQQVDSAHTPKMDYLRKLWYENNDCTGFAERPLITIEMWTFGSELLREINLECETEESRRIEYGFKTNRIYKKYIDDDNVIPDKFYINPHSWFKPFDTDVKIHYLQGSVAYKYEHPVKDLSEDFYKLKKSAFGVNYKGALDEKAYYEDIFGDIMPVEISGTICFSMARAIFNMLGMENMMYSMYDYPDEFHRMMESLTEDFLEYLDLFEKEGLCSTANNAQSLAQGTRCFTRDLPNEKNNGMFTLKDMWGYMDSQETSEISPEMYEEFFFPYFKRITDRWGLLSYGCCEPVHNIWNNCISKFKNLRKVSISPWCDEEFMGEVLRGKKITYLRKPFPNFLGVDKEFDEKGFREHIKKTLICAKGCNLEFAYRDVYSLMGEKYRANKAYNIILDMIDRYWNK
jgi:hypothetical protein